MAENNPLAGEKIVLGFTETTKPGSQKITKFHFSSLRGVQHSIDVEGEEADFEALMLGTNAMFFFIDAKEECKRFFKTTNSTSRTPRAMDFDLVLKVIGGGKDLYPVQAERVTKLTKMFRANEAKPEMLEEMLDIYKSLLDPMKQFSTVIKIESDAIPAFAEMEYFGFKVDISRLEDARQKYAGQLSNATLQLAHLLGEKCPRDRTGQSLVNWRSPQDLLDVLRKAKVMVKEPSGKIRPIEATNQTELSMIHENDDVRDAIKEFKDAADTFSKCHDKLIEEAGLMSKRVKPKFNQIGAGTGRTSVEKPSLSSLPARLRRIVVAEKDEVIITADYDQCELRILTHISRDPSLMYAFANNVDIHNYVAQKIFDVPVPNDATHPNYGFREKAKGVNYGLSYGQGAKGLAIELGISIEEATEIYNRHKAKFKIAHDCLSYLGQQAFTLGYAKSIAGRARFFDKSESEEWEIRRQGTNMTMQGTSADMIKMALGKLVKVRVANQIDFVIWNTTYDSISVRASTKDNNHFRVIQALKATMEGAMKAIIPSVPPKVSVEMGDCWQ